MQITYLKHIFLLLMSDY